MTDRLKGRTPYAGQTGSIEWAPARTAVPYRFGVRPEMSTRIERVTDAPFRSARIQRITKNNVEWAPDLSSLYTYQVEGVLWLRKNASGLLTFEMRLGKTAVSLRALPRGGRTIVICPLSLRLAWRDEVLRWRPDLKVRVLGATAPKHELIPGPGEVVIVNYEGLPDPVAKGLLFLDDMSDVTLILDEAHLVKNPDALRTKRVRALAAQVRSVWALTGTPLLGNPLDLWGLLETCRLHKKAFGTLKNFLRIFKGHKREKGLGPAYVFEADAGGHAEARDALKKVMLRKRRADVFPDMPQKSYTDIPVDIGKNEIVDAAEAEWQLLGKKTGLQKLPPFELLSAALAELARVKIAAMLEEVTAYEDAGLPLLVFSAHSAPIKALDRREGWALIDGETPVVERHKIVARFQAGELRGVAIGIKAGGVGLALHRAADVLFVSLEFTPALNAQAEDRAVSVQQQDKRLHIARLVADHPLDRRLFEILGAKETLIAGVVG